MAPRPRCPICRSKRWHRDALSGSIVCEEGHLLAGYVQESIEAEQPSQHFLQARRERRGRGRKPKPPSNDHFHGDRATFLVYQAMQLILREQLRVLVDDLGWPVQLEPVARDLWTLLVASSDVPAAPVDFANGDENPASYSGPRPGDRYTVRGRGKYKTKGKANVKSDPVDDNALDVDADGDDDDDDDEAAGRSYAYDSQTRTTNPDRDGESIDTDSSEGESSPSSYFSEGDDADDERPRPDGASRRASPSGLAGPSRSTTPFLAVEAKTAEGSQPDPVNPYEPPPPRLPRRGMARPIVHDPRAHPRLDFLLYIIYLACVTLRLPVFLSDIFRLAETYQIPYLDAGMHLPAEMQAHLGSYHRHILSPVSVPHLYPTSNLHGPDISSAQAWLARLVRMYREDWQVEFPEANLPLLSGRVCRLLALPPIAHILIRRILSLLPQPISFHLPTHLAPTPRQRFSPLNAALVGSSRPVKGLPKEFNWRARKVDAGILPDRDARRAGDAGRSKGSAPTAPSRKTTVGSRKRQDWRMMLPEHKVTSVAILVAKMLWNLEGSESSLDCFLEDYTDDLPPAEAWLDTVEAIANLDRPGDPSRLWSKDVVDMEGDEIDAYLDFFESSIVSQAKAANRLEDLGRYFPKPVTSPSALAAQTSTTYLDQLDELTMNLYASRRTDSYIPPETEYPTYPIAGSTDSPSTSLPTPLARLFVALSTHVLPVPTTLAVSLQGAAPSLSTSPIAYLAPHVSFLESLLALRSVPNQTTALNEARAEERRLWNEAKTLAEDFSKERWSVERERRRRVDRAAKEKRRADLKARQARDAERKRQRKEERSRARSASQHSMDRPPGQDDGADSVAGDVHPRIWRRPSAPSKTVIGDSSEEEIEREIQRELDAKGKTRSARKPRDASGWGAAPVNLSHLDGRSSLSTSVIVKGDGTDDDQDDDDEDDDDDAEDEDDTEDESPMSTSDGSKGGDDVYEAGDETEEDDSAG
ncbi:hypothetical protein JCM10212_005414 [Sporobolomyces blumeae]